MNIADIKPFLIDYQPSEEGWSHGNLMQWRLKYTFSVEKGVWVFWCEVSPCFVDGEVCPTCLVFQSYGHHNAWVIKEVKHSTHIGQLKTVLDGIQRSVNRLMEENRWTEIINPYLE